MQDFIDRYKRFAQQQGWDFSEQHKMVIREIFNLHAHFTEKELAEHVRLAKIPAKTRTTVLEHLVASGLVRKMFFGEKNIYYEHVYGHVHHDHLICIHCGKITEFQDDKIEQRQKAVCKKHEFKMVKHSLYILGECARCQEKNKHPMSPEVAFVETKQPPEKGGVPLSTIPSGECVKIVSIQGGPGLQRRLLEMGLVPGAMARVISNRFSGPFVIKVHEGRLAIGHQVTHKVMVRLCNASEKKHKLRWIGDESSLI